MQVHQGEVVAVIGPSGTGQIDAAALHRPAGSCPTRAASPSGRWRCRRPEFPAGSSTSCGADGEVFQQYSLFANKTALQNITEPLIRVKKMRKEEARQKAREVLKLVGLEDKEDAYPSHLSGGQQQRVGIGRAIATGPKLMLLDEPTSSLDPELVGGVLEVIRKLAARHMTMLLTTHEMDFARSVADRGHLSGRRQDSGGGHAGGDL